jgi:hypothetical protein
LRSKKVSIDTCFLVNSIFCRWVQLIILVVALDSTDKTSAGSWH